MAAKTSWLFTARARVQNYVTVTLPVCGGAADGACEVTGGTGELKIVYFNYATVIILSKIFSKCILNVS